MLRAILQEYKNLTDIEREILRFWGKIFISESSKTVILLLFFLIIDKCSAFLFSLGILLPLRCNMGGLHFNSYTRCLLATWGIFVVPICILPHIIEVNKGIAILSLFVCFAINLIAGPVINPTRPALFLTEIRNIRMRISVAFIIYVILIQVILSDEYIVYCIGIIIEQTLQLIIAKCTRKEQKDGIHN
ncbi:MAG: hypothetical protein E7264_11270 [Lachnospiraceae bacterium]|nr:hypothetical protein [Lachnospiraceae bacterium]